MIDLGIDPMILANYGILGLWTAHNIYNLHRQETKTDLREEKLSKVIENNTVALIKVEAKL